MSALPILLFCITLIFVVIHIQRLRVFFHSAVPCTGIVLDSLRYRSGQQFLVEFADFENKCAILDTSHFRTLPKDSRVDCLACPALLRPAAELRLGATRLSVPFSVAPHVVKLNHARVHQVFELLLMVLMSGVLGFVALQLYLSGA